MYGLRLRKMKEVKYGNMKSINDMWEKFQSMTMMMRHFTCARGFVILNNLYGFEVGL